MRKRKRILGIMTAVLIGMNSAGIVQAAETETAQEEISMEESVREAYQLEEPFYFAGTLPKLHVESGQSGLMVRQMFQIQDEEGSSHEIALEGIQNQEDYSGYRILADGEEAIAVEDGEDHQADLYYLKAGGHPYLYLVDKTIDNTGNEWVDRAVFYVLQDHKLTEVMDVTAKLRGGEENLFSEQSTGSMEMIGKDTLLFMWVETSESIGRYTALVPFKVNEEGGITLPSTEFKIQYGGGGLSGDGEWTASKSFETSSQPGGEKDGLRVSQQDSVVLAKKKVIDGISYYLVQKDGEQGWLTEPEDGEPLFMEAKFHY